MSKKLWLFAAAIAGISCFCVRMVRGAQVASAERDGRVADAQWANEGGANSPPTV